MTPKEEAERLLPCFCFRHIEPFRDHHETCPAFYRPAVEAILAERDDEFETAEGMRCKAEWSNRHATSVPGTLCLPCGLAGRVDERHNWTDEQWISETAAKK